MANKIKEVGIRLSVKEKEVVERAFQSMGKEGDAALKKIMRAANPASTSLVALNKAAVNVRGTMSSFAGGMVAGLVPTLSLIAAVNGAKTAMKEFGDIADRSKSSGLDPEYFQGLAYKAKLAGVEIDELAGSLDTFYKNSELAEKGRGKLYTQLKAVNPELLKSIQLADSQEKRLALVADALDRTADKAGLAGALFGDLGPRMAAIFEGGSANLDRTIEKAKELGLVVDRDLIARADEMGDEFDTATKVLDLQFKQILIEIAPWLTTVAGGVAELVRQLRELGSAGPTAVSTQQLKKDIADYKEMLTGDKWVADRPGVTQRLSMAEVELANRQNVDTGTADLHTDRSGFDFGGAIAAGEAAKLRVSGGGGVPADEKAAKLAEDRAKRIGEVTKNLKEQLAALTMTDREQAIANSLSQAHITSADKEAAAVERLAGQYYDQKEAIESANTAAKFFAQTTETALEGLIDGSKSVVDVLDDVVKGLEKAVLQAALLGEGPLAGLLGTKPQNGDAGGVLGTLFGALVSGVAGGISGGSGAASLGRTVAPSTFNFGSFLRSANGNAFGPSALSAYTNSIVTQRTPFMFANGAGIMGEKPGSAGEAILPLLRDAKGRLGVSGATGGAAAPVTVNLSIERRSGSGEDGATANQQGNMLQLRAFIYETAAEGVSKTGNPLNRSLRTTFGARRQLTVR